MTQDELDKMWHIAMRTSIEKGEMYTRYEFAKLVAAAAASKEREACIHVCKEIYSAWVCESDDDVDYPDPNDCIRAIRARGEPTSRGES